MKILVTGGTGFIGSHSAAALIAAGHEVRMLVRSKEKMDRVMDYHGVTISDFAIADVTDRKACRQALSGCDGVIHSAAMVSTARRDAERVYHTNVEGTRNIVGQAVELGLSHIIHVSSVTAVYDPQAQSLDESSSSGHSDSPYGRSKIACEDYVRALQAEGEPIIITYPAGVIGPGDPALTEPLQGLVMFLNNLAITTSSGVQFVDVRDIAELHAQLFDEPARPDRYMLGGHYYSWPVLTEKLEKLSGRSLRKMYFPKPILKTIGCLYDAINNLVDLKLSLPIDSESIGYATHWVYADNSKVLARPGFSFREGEDSLRDTLQWLQQAGHIDGDKPDAAEHKLDATG